MVERGEMMNCSVKLTFSWLIAERRAAPPGREGHDDRRRRGVSLRTPVALMSRWTATVCRAILAFNRDRTPGRWTGPGTPLSPFESATGGGV